MSTNNYWLKNGLINILQNGLTVVIAIVSLYLLLRITNTEDYGTWVLFLSVVSIIEVSRNGLTQEAIVKFLSTANQEEQKDITTAALFINFLMTVIISIVLLAIAPWLGEIWKSDQLSHMISLYIVIFFISGVLNLLNCVEQANLHFTGVFYSNICRQLLFLTYISFCYFTQRQASLKILTYVQILSVLFALAIAAFHTAKYFRYAKKLNFIWVKKLFHFGKYSFGVSLSAILASSIDQMMLGNLISKSASASFNIAVRITNLTDIPTNAMATIMFPQSAIKANTGGKDAIKYLYEKSVGVVLALLIPAIVLMYLLSDFTIHLLAGNKYENVIPLLKVTLLYCFFAPYGRQCGTILTSDGRTKFNFYMVIVFAVSIITFNYIFIKQFGIIGAAYGTLLSTIISFVVSQIYLNKLYNINALNPLIYAYKFYGEFYHKYIKKTAA